MLLASDFGMFAKIFLIACAVTLILIPTICLVVSSVARRRNSAIMATVAGTTHLLLTVVPIVVYSKWIWDIAHVVPILFVVVIATALMSCRIWYNVVMVWRERFLSGRSDTSSFPRTTPSPVRKSDNPYEPPSA